MSGHRTNYQVSMWADRCYWRNDRLTSEASVRNSVILLSRSSSVNATSTPSRTRILSFTFSIPFVKPEKFELVNFRNQKSGCNRKFSIFLILKAGLTFSLLPLALIPFGQDSEILKERLLSGDAFDGRVDVGLEALVSIGAASGRRL